MAVTSELERSEASAGVTLGHPYRALVDFEADATRTARSPAGRPRRPGGHHAACVWRPVRTETSKIEYVGSPGHPAEAERLDSGYLESTGEEARI